MKLGTVNHASLLDQNPFIRPMRGTRLSDFHGNPEIPTSKVNKAMGLTEEDRYLIKNLFFHKGYGAIRLIKEFPGKKKIRVFFRIGCIRREFAMSWS